MRIETLNETILGMFSLYRKAKQIKRIATKLKPLTEEHRKWIITHNPYYVSSNADIRYEDKQKKYIVAMSARVIAGNGQILFTNERGVLKALVDVFPNNEDFGNPKVDPIKSTVYKIKSAADIKKILIDELKAKKIKKS